MQQCNRLNPYAFGLAMGIFWGGMVIIFGLLGHSGSYGKAILAMYPMFAFVAADSFKILGYAGVIAFIDSLIVGMIIAGLYNCFSRYCGSLKTGSSCCGASACKCECTCCKKS